MPLARTDCRLLLCCVLGATGASSHASEPASAELPRLLSGISVIELPAPAAALPGGERQRSHHALSFATDVPKPWLRSLGLEPRECSLRFRLPTQISPSRYAAGGVQVKLQAQAGLGCKF